MNTSRRSMLRNTALLSLGAAVQPRLLVPGAFAQDPQKVKTISAGVRVIFAGSWLFCGIKKEPGFMYAVARDMEGSAHPHIFPYGVWHKGYENGMRFDRQNPSVPASYSATTDRVTEHPVTIGGYSPADQTLASIFAETQNWENSFTYIDNTSNTNYELDLNPRVKGIRIIKLPIPTRIHATAILNDAKVQGSQSINVSRKADKGLSVTHIFEYDAAQSVQFADHPQEHVDDQRPIVNFHIHTVVKDVGDVKDHSADMFANLMGVLTLNGHAINATAGADIWLTPPSSDPPDVKAGDDLPDGISSIEVEVPPRSGPSSSYTKTVASCSGGGIGLLPPPCCD